MEKPKLVLIGNGMAGVRTLEELLKIAPGQYEITVFGAEPHPNYNRILLSPVLAGEMQIQDIILNELDWYAENGIRLHIGKTVTKIDRVRRLVIADDGTEARYDRLLIATGSTPFRLPVPGNQLPGVIGYRDIQDTDEMIAAARQYRHAVVIGGGLLGLEAANGLQLRGMDVTVVHNGAWLLERQLDEVAGRMLQRSLEDKGLKFLLHKQTEALLQAPDGGSEGRVGAVRFQDGMQIPADLVVMAAGIRPNYALAEAAGIHCNRGIVVSDTLQTYDPRIYAVGECVSHRGIAYGLVAPLFEQAKVAANHLARHGIGRYQGSVTSTKLKVTGIDLFSGGDFQGAQADSEAIILNDPHGGVYKKLILKDNKLIGGVLYGDTADGAWYFQLIRDGRDIHEIRDQLIFGQSQIGDAGNSRAAEMADSAEVCGCNAHTLAKPDRRPVCGCTEHSHQVVRESIVAQRLTRKEAVFDFLEWKTPNGCEKCRPAIHYYLISSWPHEDHAAPQSRLINERGHANIQKDGSHSVKLTGGQRIDLLGSRKEDLRAIWSDLNAAGMVSGHATGQSIRTVKTCVGAEVAQLLCKVRTEQEVMEHAGAFLQLYREQGWYLERTCHWLARVGLDTVKGQVVEDEANRRALHGRLLDALQDAKDPWQTAREAGAIQPFIPIRLEA